MKFFLPFRRLPSRPSPTARRSARLRLEALEERSLPSVVNWTNPAGGDWNTPGNWSTGALPGPGDDVVINVGSGTVTHSSGTHSVHSLSSANDFTLSGGSLTLADTSALNGTFTLSGGTLTERSELDLNGAFSWTGGTLAGHGTTVANAGIALSGSGGKALNQQTLDNVGTATWTGGNLSFTNNAVWDNGGTFDVQTASTVSGAGTFDNAGAVRKSAGAGTAALNVPFNNSGTLDVVSGALALGGGSVSGGRFTVEANTTLSFSAGTATLTASSTLGGAGDVGFTGGTFNLLGAYTVTGDTAVSAGTANFNTDATLTTLTLSGGALGGMGTVTVTGLLTWTGGSLSDAGRTVANGGITLAGAGSKLLSGRTLDNAGTATWTGTGVLVFNNRAVWNNPAGSVLDVRNDALLDGPGTTINNAGRIVKSAGTGTTTLNAILNNSGTVDAASGALSLNAGGVNGATFRTEAGGALLFGGGSFYVSPGATLPDNATLAGGALDVEGDVTLATLALASGVLTGPGTVTVTGLLTWTGGTMSGSGLTCAAGGMHVSGANGKALLGRTLDNAGYAVWQDVGGLPFFSAAVWNNLPGSTLDIRNDASLGGGLTTLNNAGAILKSAGSGTTTLNATLNNTGTLEVMSGTVNLTGGGDNSSNFTVDAGARLGFAGPPYLLDGASSLGGAGDVSFGSDATVLGGYAVLGTTTVSGGTVTFDTDASLGALTLSGGVLTGSGTVTGSGLLTWTAGNMSGTGTTFAAGGMSLSGPGGKALVGRTLDNAGYATWQDAGALTLIVGTVWNNLPGSTLDIRTDAVLGATGATLNNAGAILKSAGSGTTTVTAALNNTGTLEVASGTLSLNGGGDNSSNFTVDVGARLAFGASSYLLDGASSLAGAGDVSFGSDTAVLGAYAVTGTTTVSGGTVRFDVDVSLPALVLSGGALTGPSTVTVSGPFTWTGGTLSGTGTTEADGGIAISGANDKHLNGRTLINVATATVTGTGGVEVVNNAVFWNLAGSALDFQNDAKFGTFSIFDVRGTLINDGTIQKSAGSGVTHLDLAPLNNRGTVDAQSGTLDLSGGGLSSGTFLTEPGATLEFGGSSHYLTAGSSVRGAGNVLFGSESFNDLFITLAGSYAVGGTTTLQATGGGPPSVSFLGAVEFSSLSLIAGTLNGGDAITVDGLLTWTGGTLSGTGPVYANGGLSISGPNAKALDGCALINAGAATWGGAGNVTFSNGASFDNAATGTFDVQTDATFGGSGAVFTNEGTFKKSAGLGTTTLNGAFTNSGTLKVDGGTLALGGDLENDGEVDLSSAATLRVNGLFIQFAGATNLEGGTLTVTTGDSLLDLEGGALNGPGTVNANVLNAALIRVGGDGGVGLLTLTGNLTETTAGVLSVDLGGPGAGQYDRLHVSGTASLDGALQVSLIGAYVPAAGDSFAVLTYASEVGDFSTEALPSGTHAVLGSTTLTLQA
jgi:hypothetical protein